MEEFNLSTMRECNTVLTIIMRPTQIIIGCYRVRVGPRAKLETRRARMLTLLATVCPFCPVVELDRAGSAS